MNAPAASVSHRNSRLKTAMSAAATARRSWGRVDPDHITESWQEQVGPLTGALTASQITAARSADGYLSRLLGDGQSVAPVASVVPEAFGGIASDGRSLTSLVRRPAVAALATIAQGGTIDQAMSAGLVSAAMICSTQVLDAGRAADECATAARPRVVEYTRVVEDTACDRCVILAGQTYRWSEGFLRHPQCACQTIPLNPDDVPEAGVSPRSVFDSMDEETQNRRFGRDQAEAIREGADPGQVVNARRGMQVTQDGRRVTTEGTTRRGHAGSRMGDFEGDGARARSRKARPMPEQIMRDNRDNREEAIAQLREYGYLD